MDSSDSSRRNANPQLPSPVVHQILEPVDGPDSTGLWLVQEDATRFAAFRIVLGVTLLADVIHLYIHRILFSSLKPSHWPISIILKFVLLLWAMVLSWMIIGYRTRRATIANYFCCVLILGFLALKVGFSQVAGDSIAISLSLLAIILPCGAVFAVDRMGVGEKPLPSVTAARWVLAGYLSSVYVDSAIHKLISPMWSSGLGLTTPMGLPSLVWMNTSWTEWFPAPLLRIVSWGVIVFELSFPLFYAWRRTRILTVLSGIAMHIGIGLVYPIPIFSALMISIYAGLLPDKYYAPLRHVDKWIAMKTLATGFGTRVVAFSLPLKSRLAVAALVLWSLCVGVVYAPKSQRWHINGAIFAITGIRDHAVFGDWQFSNYNYQLRLIRDGFGSETAVPYSRNGLFDWSVRDRVWENWWKHAQAPWTSLHDAEFELVTWADVYWHSKTDSVTVQIEGRPQRVELRTIDTALFSRNNAVAWRKIGTIRLNHGSAPVIMWANPPRKGEDLLGNYLPQRSPKSGHVRSPENRP
jgi:hypothetical protein